MFGNKSNKNKELYTEFLSSFEKELWGNPEFKVHKNCLDNIHYFLKLLNEAYSDNPNDEGSFDFFQESKDTTVNHNFATFFVAVDETLADMVDIKQVEKIIKETQTDDDTDDICHGFFVDTLKQLIYLSNDKNINGNMMTGFFIDATLNIWHSFTRFLLFSQNVLIAEDNDDMTNISDKELTKNVNSLKSNVFDQMNIKKHTDKWGKYGAVGLSEYRHAQHTLDYCLKSYERAKKYNEHDTLFSYDAIIEERNTDKELWGVYYSTAEKEALAVKADIEILFEKYKGEDRIDRTNEFWGKALHFIGLLNQHLSYTNEENYIPQDKIREMTEDIKKAIDKYVTSKA